MIYTTFKFKIWGKDMHLKIKILQGRFVRNFVSISLHLVLFVVWPI